MSTAVVNSTECPFRQAAWPRAIARCGLPEADVADQDDVGLGCDEGQAEQVLDVRAVDLLGPAPLEVIEGFEHGEARFLDPSLDAAVLAQVASPSTSCAR